MASIDMERRRTTGPKGGWTPEMLAKREKALGKNPYGGHNHNAIGIEFFYGRSWHNAIMEFEKAIEINPWKADFKVNLGRAYLAAGDMAKARKALLAALDQEPKHADGLFAMALLCEKNKEYEDAINWYRLCILAKPSYGIKHDAEESIELLVAEMRRNPKKNTK